ncbi:hypothetical protein D3C78_1491660 [compost metagenome]
MHHRTATDHRPGHQRGVSHIAFDELDPRVIQRQVAALAGGQVIKDTHRIALGEQGIGEVRTNETGAAGDQNRTINHDDKTYPVRPGGLRARREA